MNKQNKMAGGFTLLEVLVALVVLSIGLLGIAGMHIDGVRTSQSALQRTYAVNFASDMADRIRANPLGDYDVGAGASGVPPATVCADTEAGNAPADCAPNAMATYDIWQWRSGLEDSTGLPNGQGQLVLDPTTSPVSMEVTVNWTDKGDPRSYRLTVQL